MRMIFIGRSMAGKTTLCQYLNEEDLNYHKTQTVQVVNGEVIDTPGEYLEQAYLRGALTVSAADEKGTMFSPGFASRFAKPCIGIVTKSDLGNEKQIHNATRYLQIAGARKVFITSSYEGKGFKELITYFDEKKDEFALTKRVTVR